MALNLTQAEAALPKCQIAGIDGVELANEAPGG